MRMTRLQPNLGLLAVAFFLAVAAVQIRTQVTGQDPDSYLHLARQLTKQPIGSATWREALTYVAPGFPLLLAATRKLAGPFAVMWINVPFAVMLFLAMDRLVRRFGWDEAERAALLLGAAAALFLGRPENTWFLLYPFRETSATALALGALAWLAVRPPSAEHPGSALGAGLLLLGAAAIRETMAVLWFAAAAWTWMETRPASRRPLVWLHAPLAGALLLAAALVAAGWQPSQQWARVLWRFNVGPDVSLASVLAARVLRSCAAHAALLREQLTWGGVLLAAVGFWRLRGNRTAGCLLALPAGLLFLVYGFFPPHRRYALASLLFFAPYVGAGLATLLDAAGRLAEARLRRALRGATLILGSVGLFLALLVHAARMTPWGPRVTGHDIRELLTSCGDFAAPGDVFRTELACRWINNALAMYGPFRVDVAVQEVPQHTKQGTQAFFLKPLDAAAFFKPALPRYPVHEFGRIRQRMNLSPLKGPEGAPRRLQFAGAAYEVYRMAPWSERLVRDRVRLRAGEPSVIWLDLQDIDAAPGKEFRALDAQGGELGRWSLPQGRGMVGLFLPTAPTAGGSTLLEAASDAVLPDPFVASVSTPSRPAIFDATVQRSLSVDGWFEIPGEPRTVPQRHAAAFSESMLFHPPPILGAAREMEVLFILSGEADLSEAAVFVNTQGDRELSRHRVDGTRRRQYNSFVVPLGASGNTPPVRVELQPSAVDAPRLRLDEVRIWVR